MRPDGVPACDSAAGSPAAAAANMAAGPLFSESNCPCAATCDVAAMLDATKPWGGGRPKLRSRWRCSCSAWDWERAIRDAAVRPEAAAATTAGGATEPAACAVPRDESLRSLVASCASMFRRVSVGPSGSEGLGCGTAAGACTTTGRSSSIGAAALPRAAARLSEADRGADRLPAAFAFGTEPCVDEAELPCDLDTGPRATFSAMGGGTPRCVAEERDPDDEAASRNVTSDPVDDWELGRLASAGRLLDADELATNFLADPVPDFLSDLVGGGRGRISWPATAVLPDEPSSSFLASSSDAWGDMKRAVGRGPEADGPLGFFRMECVGGGFADDEVLSFFGGGDASASPSSLPSCSPCRSRPLACFLSFSRRPSSSCWLRRGVCEICVSRKFHRHPKKKRREIKGR